MIDNITELFLSEYFFVCCAAGKLISDRARLFDKLGRIFLIDAQALEKYRALCAAQEVADIRTYGDYLRFCRINSYIELEGGAAPVQKELRDIISVKGAALGKADALKLGGRPEQTEAAVFRALSDGATQGIIAALRIAGLLRCEGIYTERDEATGLYNIDRAARWNNVEGILYALYYDYNRRELNMNRLCTVADDAVYLPVLAAAERVYGVKASRCLFESVLLQKAFAANKLKPEQYAQSYARFIFSPLIGERDKERTLFNMQEQAVSDIAELPLKLAQKPRVSGGSAFESLPLRRGDEFSRIRTCLENSDLLTHSAYRPLCICSDSEYLRKLYMRAVRGSFGDAHIEVINIAELDEYDIEPSGNNVFVRSCDEDAPNVYILSFIGNIKDGVMQDALGFLQTRRRKKFCLLRPAANIDLGMVLPVCFCDKANAKALKGYCDMITAAAVTAEEKPYLFADMADFGQRLYGVKSVTISDGATEKLKQLSVDRAANVIDRTVRFNRRGDSLVITPELIAESAAEYATGSGYGFGGDADEI